MHRYVILSERHTKCSNFSDPVYVQTYEQQIICHVLLHFLFLYYTVSILKLLLYLTCSSVMETPKVQ